MDWLYRPVLAGYLRAESLLDPDIPLDLIARLNEALDIRDENEYRMTRAMREQS